jgi:hypothetical protein
MTKSILDALGTLLQTTLQKHFSWPVYCVMVAPNGHIRAVVYNQAPDGQTFEVEQIVDHGSGVAYPVNALFVDSEGRGERILLTAPRNSETKRTRVRSMLEALKLNMQKVRSKRKSATAPQRRKTSGDQ